MIILDVYKEDGFKLTWPYHPDAQVRYAIINTVKRTAGFTFNPNAKAWVSEGPEVLLDMDRIDLWEHVTEITPQAAARAAFFRALLEGIIEAKHEEHEGQYGYQQAGTNTLVLQDRSILADDMGLGKSKQSLDAIAKLGVKRILVVAPKTLTYNWAHELEKWYPSWTTIVASDDRKQRKAQWSEWELDRKAEIAPAVFIVNYEKLRLNDWDYTRYWDVVVLDEAQKLKNTAAQISKAAKKLKTDRMWALTGTPMEIRIEELYGIMSLLRPSVFGNYIRFREQHLVLDAWGNVIGPRNLELLKDRIAPWMTRRRKTDVLKQLPPKLYNTVYVDLSPAERAGYKHIKDEFIAWLDEHGKSANEANSLTQMLRLQQYTSSPDLLADMDDVEVRGTKYAELLDIIKEYDGRIMVFTRFEQMAMRLLNWLCADVEAHPEAYITGGVKSEERVPRVELFNNGKLGKVFISTDAGAYGLNVTGADLIIHYDQLWNPGKMWQREDRLHRIGQENPVNVLNLVCSETVDEGMLKVLDKRREIFVDIVDGAEEKAISKLGAGSLKKIVEGKL